MRSKSTELQLRDRPPKRRRVAQGLCLILGIIGAFPLFAGLLLRNSRVQRWTNATSERLLYDNLGLSAQYRATLALWPLELRVSDLNIAASNPGSPALRARSLRFRPRLFSLLAGRIDLGEVQVLRPELRLVIRDGKLKNLSYRLPESRPSKSKVNTAPPFASLTVSDAHLDLDIDGRKINSSDIDIDVFAERGPSFEITVKGERTVIDMQHKIAATKTSAEVLADDEDILCNLELRAHLAPGSLHIRRFSVSGLADLDPKSGTRGTCSRNPTDKDLGQFALNLSEFVANWAGRTTTISGKVAARLPLAPANRFLPLPPIKGWVSLNAQVKWDATHKLPEMSGYLNGDGIQLERYHIADKLAAEFSINQDVLNIKRTELVFAEGRTVVHDTKIQPFEKDAPFSSRLVETHGMTFPGLMRALGVTPHTIVAWNFGDGQVTEVKGQLALPHIEGHLRTDTHDFEVFDRSYDDPARRTHDWSWKGGGARSPRSSA